jgi:tRNA (guanosine-2'-O-)-methyltransferase
MFPYGPEIQLNPHLSVHHSVILEQIGPLLTSQRRSRIDEVVEHRNFSTAVVLEGIYDRGNVSAVMRTAEGLGFANFHVIETQERFKEANRVTQGADKWVEVKKWKTTKDAVKTIKDQGYQLVVTTLEASKPIEQVDFTVPTALVLGNEKDGASQEMIAAADQRIIIPMNGFVQSFNISVAGAVSLYHIYRQRIDRLGRNGDLSEEQKQILKALYYLRTQDSAPDVLERFLEGRALV